MVAQHAGVGFRLVGRSEQTAGALGHWIGWDRPKLRVPENREPHNQGHDDQADDRVMENGVREERLTVALLEGVLALIPLATFACS